jgi:hypothetical protein
MSSPVIVTVKCQVYLIRFLEKLYGDQPISFPRRHEFNSMLDFFLSIPPSPFVEPDYGEMSLRIALPFFENKDIRSYNYLSDLKQQKFEKRINEFFKIHFHSSMDKHINLGFVRKDSIELFMDEYNLPADCIDLLDKDYARYVTIRWKRRLFRNKKNSAVKRPQNDLQEL